MKKDIRTFRVLGKLYFLKKFQILLCFSIYNSKLHDICSTSNLVYPPFKAKIAVFTTFKDPISLWTFLYYFLIHDSKLYNTYMFNVNLQKGAVAD